MPIPSRAAGAVVIGLDSITGLQTARILAARGIRVTAIAAAASHPSCRTNVCDRVVIARTAGEALIETLTSLASSFATPPVLVPCTDLSVLAVSQHRQDLAPAFRMVLPKPGVIELLLDKERFQSHAQQQGWPLAQSRSLRDRGDAHRAASELRFPCAIKPAVKTPQWHANTAAKVFRVATPEQLLEVFERCIRWTDRLIVQEWIDGPDTAHVTCNAYFDRLSHAHLTYVSQKLRQWPHEGGVGCLSRGCVNDEVRGVTVDIYRSLSHRGLAYLEMKRDPRTGRYLIIEPNVGRPTGRSAAADRAGIELLQSLYCDALDVPLPARREQPARTPSWIYIRQDVLSAVRQVRNGSLSPAGWARSLQDCRHDAVFSWSDPRPFFADLAVSLRKAAGHAPRAAAPATADVDFDIHGLVGLRLRDASPADARMVARQLGPFQGALTRTPDLTIRFVDHLPTDGLRWIEFGKTGFTDEAFFIVQSGKRPAAIKLPLHQLGAGMEIVCQRGARSIPSLITLVTLLAIDRGCVPLHASAFSFRGRGALVTGWAKGGKTEALLAFARHGAEYIGDEWILLLPDGRVAGMPEHIRLQDWHLAQLPALRRRLPMATKSFFRGVRGLEHAHRRISRSPARRLWPARTLDEALPALRRQLNAQFDPAVVFERQGAFTVHADLLFFMVSHDSPTVSLQPADTGEVAARMAASVEFEQMPMWSTWLAHRFAFPAAVNERLDRLRDTQRAALGRLLAGKTSFEVRHPYPCDLHTLFAVMAPAFASVNNQISAAPAALDNAAPRQEAMAL